MFALEKKKRRDEHAEIISSTKNPVSGSSAEASQRRKKYNYSSFQDLRSSCNEDMMKYEGPRPSTTKGKAKEGEFGGYAPVPALSFAPKPKNPLTPKKDNPAKDTICHQCGEVGHWRRNYPVYLAELMKKKKLSQGASTSDIFTIELNSFPSTSWVYDTTCGTHICITTQGLRGGTKLEPGALNLYVGDGHRATVKAIGEFHLCLPSGLVLILQKCHYAASITRGIISVSRLYKDGFVNHFENDNSISVSRNNLIYFNAIPWDDIYEIDLSSSNTNDSSMYVVSNKRAKLNLDSTLLWHCRLGHINKKHREKLQHDGLLDSIDIKSFEKCVSCMSGKMARKPYSHEVERAKDLLGLIHTDVCGPFKIMSRQGANYFVTFTDDFSRYGYVYLLKHKHEVFETFKVFQKEVENQLGKTIKSLRSNRGGYPKETMGYSFYYPPENKVFVARNAEFLENSFITQEASGSLEDLEVIQEEDTYPSIDTSLHHEEDNQEIDKPQSDINLIRDLGEPANYKAALLDPESDKWLNAMNVEMQSMKDNEVWILVELPPNGKTVGSKWLFKKKTDMDGAVHTYKARLVAKGYTQTPGIDYEETFSHVADIRAIRILIAITAYYDYEIWQMDVKTAFLNGYLNEEVYMEQPEGFVNPKYPNRVPITPAEFKRMQSVPYASAWFYYVAVDMYSPDVACFAQHHNKPIQKNQVLLTGRSAKQSILRYFSADAEYIVPLMLLRKPDGLGIISGRGVVLGFSVPKFIHLAEVMNLDDLKLEKFTPDDNLVVRLQSVGFSLSFRNYRNMECFQLVV
ncbi:retrotransposon protein, putative, ty1-copia subclass [Tanacetum coccineum]